LARECEIVLNQTFEYSSARGLRHLHAGCRRKRSRLEKPDAHRTWERCAAAIIVSVTSGRGTFITFEGLDGCGKSTQLDRLAGKLREAGLTVTITREPGGTATGNKIRQLLLDTRTAHLDPRAELALMFASRAQHLAEIILPALARGEIVLCDRFTDSSEAYQGGGRKLGSQPVLELHRVLWGNLNPDLTILMDSDVAASVERARRRNQARISAEEADENRFERENRTFFTRVHTAYLDIAKREPERVFVVDARGTPDQTHIKILDIVRSRLGLESGRAQNVR
jgi:dTMP kinase